MSVEEQFKGLSMSSLIGGPLKAACDAQMELAKSTAEFISQMGFDENNKCRTVEVAFKRPGLKENGNVEAEQMKLEVPLLSIVPIPNLQIDEVNVLFEMEIHEEVKGEEKSIASVTGIDSPFGLKVNISGNVSSITNNMDSDNSAKYHVQVRATQGEMPEGLSRVLDILNTAINPTSIQKTAAAGAQGQEHYTADNVLA